MYSTMRERLAATLEAIHAEGLRKDERAIESPQGARVGISVREVLNSCANAYLGLAVARLL